MLKLYHTYQKKLLPFSEVEKGTVKIYNCGPTVYDFSTIGNLRAYVFDDFLRRTFEYLGYKVIQVMNITDVGHLTLTELQKEKVKEGGEKIEITDTDEGLDRMEKAAKREGMTVKAVAQRYIDITFGKNYIKVKEFEGDGDFGKMNIKKPHHMPRATEYINEQKEIIKKLEEKGFTYKTKQAVYFDINKFPKYEDLVEQSFEDMKKGKRADTTDPDRKHPADFRLWQLNQPEHAMQWNSPWGKGFPGWHIECSAMSSKILGQPFDIHTGGEDHIKVHHPAEIAQSESAYGKTMANYWMHNAFLTVDGKRMGKSLGNAYTLKDIEKYTFAYRASTVSTKGELHLNSLALRYLFMGAHYRTKQNFTWKAFEKARISLGKIIDKIKGYQKSSGGKVLDNYKKKFTEALEDDINIPQALAVLWKLIRSKSIGKDKYATILDFDRVLGLRLDRYVKEDVPKEALKLVKQRELARKKKRWDEADKLRKELLERYSIEVEDTKEGSELRVL